MNQSYRLAYAARRDEKFFEYYRHRVGDADDTKIAAICDYVEWHRRTDNLLNDWQLRYSVFSNARNLLCNEIMIGRKVAAYRHRNRLQYRRACGEEVEILDVDENNIE